MGEEDRDIPPIQHQRDWAKWHRTIGAFSAFETVIRQHVPPGIAVPGKSRHTLVNHEDKDYAEFLERYISSITDSLSNAIMTFMGFHHDVTSNDEEYFSILYEHRFIRGDTHSNAWFQTMNTFPKIYHTTIIAILKPHGSASLITNRISDLCRLGLLDKTNVPRPTTNIVSITPQGIDIMRRVLAENNSYLNDIHDIDPRTGTQ